MKVFVTIVYLLGILPAAIFLKKSGFDDEAVMAVMGAIMWPVILPFSILVMIVDKF